MAVQSYVTAPCFTSQLSETTSQRVFYVTALSPRDKNGGTRRGEVFITNYDTELQYFLTVTLDLGSQRLRL